MNRIKHTKNTVNLEIAEKLAAAAATAAAKAKGTPAELALRGVAVHAGNVVGHQAAKRKVEDSILDWHAKQADLEFARAEALEELDALRTEVADKAKLLAAYDRPVDAVTMLAEELDIAGNERQALIWLSHRLSGEIRYAHLPRGPVAGPYGARFVDLTRQG